MTPHETDSHSRRGLRRSLNKKILTNTTLNILVLVVVSCIIMAYSMQSLANNILLDSLQPMARQSAKTVEANIHMLADRMMNIAVDPRMNAAAISSYGSDSGNAPMDSAAIKKIREEILIEAAETYELYSIALYGLDGQLILGTEGSPEHLDSSFFLTSGNRQSDHPLFHHLPGQTWHPYGNAYKGKWRNRFIFGWHLQI